MSWTWQLPGLPWHSTTTTTTTTLPAVQSSLVSSRLKLVPCVRIRPNWQIGSPPLPPFPRVEPLRAFLGVAARTWTAVGLVDQAPCENPSGWGIPEPAVGPGDVWVCSGKIYCMCDQRLVQSGQVAAQSGVTSVLSQDRRLDIKRRAIWS